jgi:hypothetical protein
VELWTNPTAMDVETTKTEMEFCDPAGRVAMGFVTKAGEMAFPKSINRRGRANKRWVSKERNCWIP